MICENRACLNLGGHRGANESNQRQQPCGGAVCAALL